MGPVFLFYMSVIVLMVRSTSSKLHGLISLLKVLHQMPIQEFRAIIAVKSKQRKRQGVFDILDLSQDVCFAFAPDCALFGPARRDIDGVDRIGKLAQEGLPTMGYGISLQEPRLRFIPLVGLNGDLFSQESAGFGGGSSPAPVLYPGRFQESIQGGGRDPFEGLNHL